MKDTQSVLQCIKFNADDRDNVDFDDENFDEEEFEKRLEIAYEFTDGKDFHNLESEINKIVTYMPNDAEVDDAFCFRNGTLQFCVLAFSNGDVTLLKETQSSVTHERSFTFGGFLDSTYSETVYGCNRTDIALGKLDDKTTKLVVHEKDVGFFRKKMEYDYAEIILGFVKRDTVTFTVQAPVEVARYVYNYIVNRMNKFADKLTEKPAAPSEPAKGGASGSNIAEIRKMYEDGLISREEMLELIKSGM